MARHQITIFRKATGVEVAADTVVLPFNPEWVKRSGKGVYTKKGETITGTSLIGKPFYKKITFRFSGQALSSDNRAKLDHLFNRQTDNDDVGNIFLRDEEYAIQTSQLINQRTGVGSTFTEGGKTRQFYEMPIILFPLSEELEIDDNPRSVLSGDVYWQGGFIAEELPVVS